MVQWMSNLHYQLDVHWTLTHGIVQQHLAVRMQQKSMCLSGYGKDHWGRASCNLAENGTLIFWSCFILLDESNDNEIAGAGGQGLQ